MRRYVIECVGSLVLSVAALGGGAAEAAVASDDIPHVAVAYDDLNLSHVEGVHKLYQRLKSAAEQVCRVYDGKDLDRHVMFIQCSQVALDNAVSAVAFPALTRIHVARAAKAARTERVASRELSSTIR
jgi:UrcA family protein